MSDGIVQARFTPGGQVYHYHCPEARIGDRIHAVGMYSNNAEVIGFGRTNGYTGYCKPAKVVEPSFTDEVTRELRRQELSKNKENPAISTADTPIEERIEQTEKLLKKQKKTLKAQAKRQAAAKAKAKERARLRKVALKALEAVATQGHGEARVQAAVELLNHV